MPVDEPAPQSPRPHERRSIEDGRPRREVSSTEELGLEAVRGRVLNALLLSFAALGLPAAAAGAFQAYRQGDLPFSLTYLGIYFVYLAGTLAGRRLSFPWRGFILLSTLFVIAVAVLLRVGLSGVGVCLFMMASVVATVLHGYRTGLLALAVSAAALLAIGIGMVYGLLEIDVERMFNSRSGLAWTTALIVFTMVTAALILSVETFRGRLLGSLEVLNDRTGMLQEANARLRVEIGSREKAEEALRFQAMLLDQISDYVLAADQEGRISYVNRTMADAVGEHPVELVGRDIALLPVFSGGETALRNILETTRRKGRWTGEETLRVQAGETRVIDLRTQYLAGGADRPGILLGIGRDVTADRRAREEKSRLESQLLQAQKMEAIGTLAGGVAHDFNNLLTSMMGYTELALLDAGADAGLRAHLEQVLLAGKRARDLVKQILAFSRRSEFLREPVRIETVVRECVSLLRATVPPSIEIRERIEAGPGTILGDPIQMQQVVMNLCMNAVHAMGDHGGRLEVILAEPASEVDPGSEGFEAGPGPRVELAVRDTGHGMERAVLDRIFEPFYTTKERGQGTGMGLAVVHGIVRAHGGTIHVSSEPGKGSTFRVRFPRLDAEPQDVAERQRTPVPGEARVLFVDDEAAIVDLQREVLERLGYRVVARTSSREALEAFRAQPDRFDVVVTDMSMPNMNGIELARCLRAIRPDIPIILCSGFSEVIGPEEARRLGIRAMLLKPTLAVELSQTIQKTLAGG